MNSKILLVIICLFFLFTRLYKISSIPLSVYWDEASIGYNAYSIAQDGKDEWGDFFPIHFRAFGEFKLPVYIYSVAFLVKIFGLNEISLRLPAVLYSLGAIILIFLLVKKLTSNSAGLWSSFFLTISPWFFIFSRTGYEATAGLMFYLLGIYLFVKKSNSSILLSVLSFILSAYSYNSFRIINPLTFLILIFFERNNFKQLINKQKFGIIISFVLIFLAMIPIYRLYVYDSGSARLQAVSSSSGMFFYNYISHLDPKFLFITGDTNLRSQQKDFAQLYFYELLLLPLGVLYLLKYSKIWLIPLLLLIGPIPAAITKESPHALRSLSMVPFIVTISALGVMQMKKFIRYKYFVESIFILIPLIFFANYFINFINIYPTQSAKDWQYDYKKIFTNSMLQPQEKRDILISDKDGQPYIFALYYLKYDPSKFRQEVVRNSVDKWGFSTVKKFGNFEFGE